MRFGDWLAASRFVVVSAGGNLKPNTYMISLPDDGGGMMDNYPSDSETAEPSTEESTPETVDEENEENASSTILAPKSAMGKMTKVGDKCMMRVVADHGDEVELEYSTSEKKPEMSSDEEIEALDKA